ncbi:hypothetical protein [Leclercia sp. Marseille-Q4284]|uniref:hypothetical protein n=1 Tax=Leclercia sp. Marseille-Q4284 TaxID=2866582 RepID=UPI001CE42550|nr:hypothetical protein [Leclercia sp. Marseille-Q4284]
MPYHKSLPFKLDLILLALQPLFIWMVWIDWRDGLGVLFVMCAASVLFGIWSTRKTLEYIVYVFCVWNIKRVVRKAVMRDIERATKGNSIDV